MEVDIEVFAGATRVILIYRCKKNEYRNFTIPITEQKKSITF